MKTTKRSQIENRLWDLDRLTIQRAYNRGALVWYVPGHRYTLTSGITCMDHWPTLDAAHTAIFAAQGIRADNY